MYVSAIIERSAAARILGNSPHVILDPDCTGRSRFPHPPPMRHALSIPSGATRGARRRHWIGLKTELFFFLPRFPSRRTRPRILPKIPFKGSRPRTPRPSTPSRRRELFVLSLAIDRRGEYTAGRSYGHVESVPNYITSRCDTTRRSPCHTPFRADPRPAENP